jgi:hypothetical protein
MCGSHRLWFTMLPRCDGSAPDRPARDDKASSVRKRLSKEDTKAHYEPSDDASADGTFMRGWLPEVLQSEVVAIREPHKPPHN